MKNVYLWSFGTICLLFLAVFFHLSRSSGVDVVVKNSDVSTMSNVVAQTSGGSYEMGDIPPNSSKTVRVDGAGGSSVKLNYTDRSGKQKRLKVDCYFESAYRGSVEAEVKSGKIASVKSHLKISSIY